MADAQTDVITTKTFFRVPPESDAAPLPPDEYEARFLQAQADTVRAYPNHPPIPDEVLTDSDKARRYFGVWAEEPQFLRQDVPELPDEHRSPSAPTRTCGARSSTTAGTRR